MTKKTRVAVLTLLCATLIMQAQAQHEATLHFMKSLPQVSHNNPAFQPRYKFSLGLPSVYAQFANNGFAVGDVIIRQGDSTVTDLAKLNAAAKDKNYIAAAAQVDLLSLGVKVAPRVYLNWNLSARTFNRLMVPKGIVEFANKASAVLDDQSDISLFPFSVSPRVEALAYLESGLGASYVVNKKLTVGARFKMLMGVANASTRTASVDLKIEDDYANIVADADVRTSGVHQFDDDDFDVAEDWDVYRQNKGFAIDLGATYQVTDKLTVGASLIDLGSITWKNDPYGYRVDPAKNAVSFKAITSEDITDGNMDALEPLLDSLNNADFSVEEGVIAAYRSPIPTKMYFSASYALRKSFSANILIFADKFADRFSAGASASIYKEFGRYISTSLSYTMTNNTYNNIGAGLTLKLLPFQFYIVGDNLLSAPVSYLSHGNFDSYIDKAQQLNVRIGINLAFGWIKTQEKLPHPGRK